MSQLEGEVWKEGVVRARQENGSCPSDGPATEIPSEDSRGRSGEGASQETENEQDLKIRT